MKKYIKQVKSQRSQEVYRLISRLQDKKMRNLLRGMSAKGHIYSKDAQSIRDHIRARDGLIVGALLKGGVDCMVQTMLKERGRVRSCFLL